MKKIMIFIVLAISVFSKDSFDFYHDNDLFITDEYYTSGFEFKYRHMSTLSDLDYYNFFFGQKFYTPSNITGTNKLNYDRPYAAWLYFGIEKEMIHLDHIKKHGIQLGITGPNALGEFVQGSIHDIIGEETPKGWKDQIQEIWGIQYYYSLLNQKYQKKENNNQISLSEHLELELGNVFTNIEYGPVFLMGNKSFYESGKKRWNYYFYYEPQIQITAYDATLKGSMYYDKSPLVKNFNMILLKNILGASVDYKNFTFEYSLNFNSTEIDDMAWKFVNHIYSKIYFRIQI